MPDPDYSIGELLDQDEIWVMRQDGKLRAIRVEDMDAAHLANLRTWLLSRAEEIILGAIQWHIGMAAHIQGEQALFELDKDIARLEAANPREWLEEQPLLQAITARMAALLEQTHGSETLCLD